MVQKKLTITIHEEVYDGLYMIIGPRNVSKFIEALVRPHAVQRNLELGYAEMARDTTREGEAIEWAEMTLQDIADETE
ncbi:MAG: addiction module antitoxin [Dehalococcoidia bacterium]|nr:addiction module antitoxin [Dehalococcoidia bacterium]